jgi:hypothetical protein
LTRGVCRKYINHFCVAEGGGLYPPQISSVVMPIMEIQMTKDQISIILNETNVLFKNIQTTLDSISEDQMVKTILKWPLSRHFYHMLHSLDQWYINPVNYVNPPFHVQGMNSFESINTKLLKKSELFEYFVSIKEKILKHIKTLTDKSLLEKPALRRVRYKSVHFPKRVPGRLVLNTRSVVCAGKMRS